jgi:hypothetical protein
MKQAKTTRFWALRAKFKSFGGTHLARGPYVVHAWSKGYLGLK